jgi:hypothetical protein
MAGNLIDVIVAVPVVVLHDEDGPPGEPCVETRRPLSLPGAARIRRRDKPKIGDIVGVLFALANKHRLIWRGDQFRQAIGNLYRRRLAPHPAAFLPMGLRKLLSLAIAWWDAIDAKIRRALRVAIDIGGGRTPTPLLTR